MTHVRLPIEPDGTNSAASRPKTSAARACSRLTVGSSRNTSSPTSASAMARRIAAEGRVTVSERRSIGGMRPNDGRGSRCLSRLGGAGVLTRPWGAYAPRYGQAGRRRTRATITPFRSTSRFPPIVKQRAAPAAHVVFELYLGILLHIHLDCRGWPLVPCQKRFFRAFRAQNRARRRSYSSAARSGGVHLRRRGRGAPCSSRSAPRPAPCRGCSVVVCTAFAIGAQKLGQPVPLSNFVSEL